MPKILILYYSRSGNTERMAKAIAEGARKVQGIEVALKNYESPQRLLDYDAILIGAPTYHHNMTDNIKRFLEEVSFHGINLKGKLGTSFGSYGWSGEAPRLVMEVMENNYEMEVLKPPLRVKKRPNEEDLENCRNLGKNISEKILK
jgi:flavorubredoxin